MPTQFAFYLCAAFVLAAVIVEIQFAATRYHNHQVYKSMHVPYTRLRFARGAVKVGMFASLAILIHSIIIRGLP